MKKPLVSIVINTKNEEKNIQNCLDSIKSQDYKEIEIIVVDNNSADKTKEISKKYTKKIFNIGPERSVQKNYGILKIARGKYVMHIDADMILSPSLVGACVDLLEKKRFVALHIPEIVLGRKYFSKVRRFERSFYDSTPIDGARFFLRDVFIKTGGFDEKLYACEDWDLDKKIKKIGKIGLLNQEEEEEEEDTWKLKEIILKKGVNPQEYRCVIYHNESEFDLKKYLNKKRYYSVNFKEYINKWSKEDPDIKKQFGVYYRFFGVFIEKNKWKRFFSKPQLVLGMYFLRFLVGITFVLRRKNEI